MIRALYVTIALTNDMFTYNKIYEAFGKELKLTRDLSAGIWR